MYTKAMKQAFRSLDNHCPKGFSVDVYDNDMFITIVAKEDVFMRLSDFEKRRAVEYISKVKIAFEANGAIVLVVREGGKDVD